MIIKDDNFNIESRHGKEHPKRKEDLISYGHQMFFYKLVSHENIHLFCVPFPIPEQSMKYGNREENYP
jgi:hypothetical protein